MCRKEKENKRQNDCSVTFPQEEGFVGDNRVCWEPECAEKGGASRTAICRHSLLHADIFLRESIKYCK